MYLSYLCMYTHTHTHTHTHTFTFSLYNCEVAATARNVKYLCQKFYHNNSSFEIFRELNIVYRYFQT